jgi:uncharacterized RDD family membrane protein YckC
MNSEALNLQNEAPSLMAHDPAGDFSVYESASVKDRIFANILDTFLMGAILKTVVPLLETSVGRFIDVKYIFIFSLVANIVVAMTYYIYPLRKYGATPGKRLMDIQVVNVENAEKLGVATIILREFTLKTISIISVIGCFLPFMRADKRALHDLMAKTRVISKKY